MRLATGESASTRAAEDVATAVIGFGIVSFLIGCVGVWLGLFGVGAVVAALISPWALLSMPVIAYALWRWQRYRLQCRVDPSSS